MRANVRLLCNHYPCLMHMSGWKLPGLPCSSCECHEYGAICPVARHGLITHRRIGRVCQVLWLLDRLVVHLCVGHIWLYPLRNSDRFSFHHHGDFCPYGEVHTSSSAQSFRRGCVYSGTRDASCDTWFACWHRVSLSFGPAQGAIANFAAER